MNMNTVKSIDHLYEFDNECLVNKFYFVIQIGDHIFFILAHNYIYYYYFAEYKYTFYLLKVTLYTNMLFLGYFTIVFIPI